MRPRAEQPTLVLILRYLSEGPATAYELAARLRLTVRNTRPYLRILLERRNVFVRDYAPARNPGKKVPVYQVDKYGDGEDEPYPDAIPAKIRARRYRARHKRACKS